jgi:phosphatidate cytidylyltransferase
MNETLKRALSGAVYILLLLSCILYSKESFTLLFGVFLAIATFEFSKLIAVNFIIPTVTALALYAVFYNSTYSPFVDTSLTAVTILTSLVLVYFLFDKKAVTLTPFLKYLSLFGYIIFPFIILTKVPMGVKGYNPKILISIFILIWINDTFAYLVGKNFGKHKLLPSISPKKTIEGFIGGIVFAIIGGIVIAKYFTHASLFIWTIIGLIVGVFSTLGDLIESKFKRIAGVKDSGNIMPGHGGILDRLDSIIFVVPFIYLFYLILNYVS